MFGVPQGSVLGPNGGVTTDRRQTLVHYNTTETQLLIVIIDTTWNVNACYYEVSYASVRSLRMRRSTSSALVPQVAHVLLS